MQNRAFRLLRSNSLRAFAGLLIAGLSACGGGGGGGGGSLGPTNTAPTANFAFTCVDLGCTFTSTSTDQDSGDGIISWNWTFGDGSVDVTTLSTSHAFPAAGTYTVSLMAGDRSGARNTVSKQVTVSAPALPAAPHASFTSACVSLDCTFTDTSTYDPGSVFQSRSWDFGDGAALATTATANHRYAATGLTTFTAKLTVTDAGGKSSSSVRSIVVAPPASSLNCVAGNCVLALTQAARVTATLVSSSCSAVGNQVAITAPVPQTVFPDGCTAPLGVPVAVNGGALFPAGTQLQVEVRSGIAASSSLVFTPSVRVAGDFDSGWTVTFDDGYGGAGEPDFNDLVILIKATP
jgi:PKD repeat protein